MLPDTVGHTNPVGGMFLMLTLPDSMHSMEIFRRVFRKGLQ
jgi:DNA-binding transcriptional MocR family regulator